MFTTNKTDVMQSVP